MKPQQPTELTEWVDAHTDELFAWALYKVSDVELAKDLVQDTFLAAAEKFGTYQGNSSPKTWLFGILNHKIIDVYRRKVKHPVNVPDISALNAFDETGHWNKDKAPTDWHDEETHLLDKQEFQAVLQKCLNALPEKWHIAVKLKYLLDKKGEEICQELDISPTNFWQIVHRAKLQLRECVDTNWFKN